MKNKHCIVHKMILGMVQTNCYIISNTKTKEAIIIDPADRADMIEEYIKEQGLTVAGILLTHGHFDHIMAAGKLVADFHISLYCNEKEKDLVSDSRLNYAAAMGLDYGIVPDRFLLDGQNLVLAGFNITAIHTPGHTIGGCCYYFEEEGILFSGDTLFFESVGRSDLPTGNESTLIASIKNKLLVLPEDTEVFTGHGDSTTIGYEKKNNFFIR